MDAVARKTPWWHSKWLRIVQWCAFVNTASSITGCDERDHVGKVMPSECEISDKRTSEFVVGREGCLLARVTTMQPQTIDTAISSIDIP